LSGWQKKKIRGIGFMENKIQEIYNRLTNDQAFAEELKKFVEARNITTPDNEVEALLEFAKVQGYDVTLDDLKDFAEKQYRSLTEEELESINAAGAGGACFLIGAGWGRGKGAENGPTTHCYVIGVGVGVTWQEAEDTSRCLALWRNGVIVKAFPDNGKK
jgi:hypothetical protein